LLIKFDRFIIPRKRKNEKEVIACISDQPKTIEELSKFTKINQIELVEDLSILELEGIIQTLPGGRFKLRK